MKICLKSPYFPFPCFCSHVCLMCTCLNKRIQWHGKGFFRTVWVVWISSGLSGCCILLQNMSQDAGEMIWGTGKGHKSRRAGMLLPLPHRLPTVCSPHTAHPRSVSVEWQDSCPSIPVQECVCADRVGKSIHCVGLDNYIFYIKQSQKLEQMPLWWQSERAAQFFLHSDIMKKGFWQNPFCPLNEVICLTKCTDSIQIIY